MAASRHLLLSVLCSVLGSLASGQQLNKDYLFPDSQGGLSAFTDLGPVLPTAQYELINRPLASSSPGITSNCNYDGAPDECAKLGLEWEFYSLDYSDGIYMSLCTCGNAPFTANQLAANMSQVGRPEAET